MGHETDEVLQTDITSTITSETDTVILSSTTTTVRQP